MNELVSIALNEIGVKEVAGVENNPRILHYAQSTGLNWVKTDETSWCSIFLYWCAKHIPKYCRVDMPAIDKAASARSWLATGFEVKLEHARQGDIVIFWRDSPSSWKGHCGIFIKLYDDKIWVLGGNQNDAVSIAEMGTDRLLGIRRI